MADKRTVHDVTYDLLRTLGLTTVFGNPGSTEQTFLQDFPDDFTYVLALQEASALAMADGFAQSTGKPALVNLHTAAGTGNAMGSLVAAYRANTPLIVTAGQQTREMSLCDPYLNNPEATVLPQPWVKWAYEPARAEDVPAAFMQAYAVAMQQPKGPVFLSIPLDDWQKPALGPAVVRTVSQQSAPIPSGCASSPSGSTVRNGRCWSWAPRLIGAAGGMPASPSRRSSAHPSTAAPLTDRASFPENHPLYAGPLPMTIAEVNQVLHGHDLVIVIGAQVFRYYPYVAGEYLPEGTDLLQITVDPHLAAAAPVGDSLLGDSRLALEQLVDMVDDHIGRKVPAAPVAYLRGRLVGVPAAGPGRGVVDPGIGQPRRLSVGDRIHLHDGRTAALDTHHPPGFLLRHRQRRNRLGTARRGWPCTRRPRARRQTHRRGDHRRRLVPVLHPGDLDRRPTQATDRVRGDAQRGILDSQVVRSARENTRSTGSGPAGTRHRLPGNRFRVPNGECRQLREARTRVHQRAGRRRAHRDRGAHQTATGPSGLRIRS